MVGLVSFLVRRILLGILVMWFVTIGTFLLFFVAPQDPARLLAGKNTTAAQIAAINRRLGLDQPLIVQYWHYLSRLVHGNLGTSYFTGESVNTILKQDLPPTLSVMVGGAILWLLAGISVGILSATRARTVLDRISTTGVLIGITFPTFVVGLLLIFFIYLPLNKHGFHWIQTGYEGPTTSVIGWIGHMILPWITIAAVSAATYTRLTRGSLLDALGEDYIRTARSKGLTERRVLVPARRPRRPDPRRLPARRSTSAPWPAAPSSPKPSSASAASASNRSPPSSTATPPSSSASS